MSANKNNNTADNCASSNTEPSASKINPSPELVHPHDRAFKYAMRNMAVAQDFCTHYLPQSIQKIVNLETLTLVNGNFIDRHLQTKESDILYQVQVNKTEVDASVLSENSLSGIHSDPSSAYIYILAEHQSTPDRWIALRLMKYLCAILSQHLNQYPNSTVLPLVVPLVFYNGIKSYTEIHTERPYTLRFLDLFGNHSTTAQALFLNAFQLIDLNQIPNKTLQAHQWSGLMELVMKRDLYQQRNLIDIWSDLIPAFKHLLTRSETAENYFVGMLTYSLYQADSSDPDGIFAMIRQQISNLHTAAEEKIMNAAQRLINRGIEQGIQQGKEEAFQEVQTAAQRLINRGIEQGIQQGKEEAFQEVQTAAQRLINRGIKQGKEEALREAQAAMEQMQQKTKQEANLMFAQRVLQETGNVELAARLTGLSIEELKTLLH